MADGPLDLSALPAALWTGAALLVWNGESALSSPRGGYLPGDAAAWDPRADRWVRLPRSPAGGADTIAVWTGRAALIWGGTRAHAGLAFTPAGP